MIGTATVTVTDFVTDPPGPVQVKVKVLLGDVRGSVNPLLGPSGDEAFDQDPPAVQLVALVELQKIVALEPYAADAGETERVAVGGSFVSVHVAVLPPPVP